MQLFCGGGYRSTGWRLFLLASVGLPLSAECAFSQKRDDVANPPPMAREFRGVWVATVENIDWPSRPGLPSEKQTAGADRDLRQGRRAESQRGDLADSPAGRCALSVEAGAVVGVSHRQDGPAARSRFTIRSSSRSTEAHRRGLQLHVWFNPYRVRVPGANGEASPDHASVTHTRSRPQVRQVPVVRSGRAQRRTSNFIAVLNDVVKRYDIDGVHIDDYFYPYPVQDETARSCRFPTTRATSGRSRRARSWSATIGGGRTSISLIQRMYDEVKKAKPWVLVGISPFGIWRPGNPPGIVGLDQYSTLYADARKWQQEGWLDYLTPQLYWQVESKGQSYPKLLAWWAEQNVKKRHLWPGNFTSKIRRRGQRWRRASAWTADELIRQIEATRATPGATGNVHFSMKALLQNRDGIADKLKDGLYAEPALVPESPWLGKETPGKPDGVGAIVGRTALPSK